MKTLKLGILALILLLAASCTLWINPVSAQSISQPAQMLTVKQIDCSYDVPLTIQTSINPYTGEQETTREGGYHVDNRTIELTIKNPAYSGDDRDWLRYNVRFKGHFISNWTELYGVADNFSPLISNSDYSVLTFVDSHDGHFSGPGGARITAPLGGKIDLQVSVVRVSVETHGEGLDWGYNYVDTQLGDWSNTETIKICEDSTTQKSASSTLDLNGTQGKVVFGLNWEQAAIAVMAAAIAVLAVGLAVVWRKLPRK